jgi:hypothetical protein
MLPDAFSLYCKFWEAWTSYPVKMYNFNEMDRILESMLPDAFSLYCKFWEAWTSYPVKVCGFNDMSRIMKSRLPLGLDNVNSERRERELQDA